MNFHACDYITHKTIICSFIVSHDILLTLCLFMPSKGPYVQAFVTGRIPCVHTWSPVCLWLLWWCPQEHFCSRCCCLHQLSFLPDVSIPKPSKCSDMWLPSLVCVQCHPASSDSCALVFWRQSPCQQALEGAPCPEEKSQSKMFLNFPDSNSSNPAKILVFCSLIAVL